MNRVRHLSVFTPIIILLAGIALTFIATWQLRAIVRARTLDHFNRAAQQARADITGRMEMYTEMLRGGAGLFAAHGIPDRDEFRSYVDRLDIPTRYPGVQGIGFSLRIRAAELESTLVRIRSDVPDFLLQQPQQRDEYHLITHLEPLDERNQHAIGFDMFTFPVRRAAMERARDLGEPAASGPVVLVQEIENPRQAGFLLYLPIYEGGDTPASVEERRRRLIGFVYSPFRADDFFNQVAALQALPLVDFDVSDADEPEPIARLRAPRADASPRAPRFVTAVPLDVAGRRWTVRFSSRPEFERASREGIVLLAAAGGGAFTLVLFLIALLQHRARERAERTAIDLERSGEHLRASEARLRAILDSAIDAVVSMTQSGIVTEWNPAAARTFGYAREEALGKPLADLIIPPYLREHHYKGLARFAATGEGRVLGQRFETMAVRADGTELPVELSIVRIGEGQPATFTGFVRDITERRRDEKHRELMTRELDHRVKNNLSTVVALVDQTASRSGSFVDFVSSFSGRVRAMARLHEMLAENRWTGADLADVVRGIMAPYMEDDPSRVPIAGEPLDLPDKIVSPLCLALHELATNAGKYGALSVPGGRVDIRWETSKDNGKRTLRLHWRETGGPPVVTPTRRGFGTELVERGLAYEIRAVSHIEYAPDGVRCEISVVIPEDVVVLHRSRPQPRAHHRS